MASGVMAGLWPLRLRSLHADFCAGERVMGINRNISGLGRDGRALAIAPKVLMCRFLGWRARYGRKSGLVASGVMAGLWPLRLRSLHADFCAGERVMGINRNISGLGRDGRALAIAPKVLMCRSLRR
ncbi:hypothetical protein PY91_08505 [Lacticaseibacillus rhamnosus]|nr:hypothetical protein PY91_08505 [Lacticaseibacillus rhamnosus]